MATLGISGISAGLNVVLADDLVKQFREDSVLLNVLDVAPASGENLVYPVKFDARSAGGAVADGADMADGDFDSHTTQQVSLPWSLYRSGVKLSDGAVDVAQATGNAFSGSLIQTEVDDAIGKIRKDVSTHLFGGNYSASPAQIAGLAAAIDSSDDDWGGINTGSYTDWKSTEGSLTSGSYTIANINTQIIRPIINATGRRPDFIVCDGTQFDYIASLFDTKADAMQSMVASGPFGFLQSQIGVRIVIAHGVPIIEDRHCTASTLYGITKSALRVRFVPVARAQVTPAEVAASVQALTGVYPSEAEVAQRLEAQRLSLSPVLVPLDKTGLSTKLMLRTPLMQLEVRRRDALAKAVVS